MIRPSSPSGAPLARSASAAHTASRGVHATSMYRLSLCISPAPRLVTACRPVPEADPDSRGAPEVNCGAGESRGAPRTARRRAHNLAGDRFLLDLSQTGLLVGDHLEYLPGLDLRGCVKPDRRANQLHRVLVAL